MSSVKKDNQQNYVRGSHNVWSRTPNGGLGEQGTGKDVWLGMEKKRQFFLAAQA